jgi:4'-phosphopantetheinyl transferase EntD
MPDYIARWLASRFIDDVDQLEDLGIMTPEVWAKKEAQQALFPTEGGGAVEAESKPANGVRSCSSPCRPCRSRRGISELSGSPQRGLRLRRDDRRVTSTYDPRELACRSGPAAMIGFLAPTSACAEMLADVPESTMFSVEAAAVAKAAPERRLEFASVRHCARQALRRIGVPAVPILPDADRVPRWPEGIVGSMTHCAGYRAAAVARSDELSGIGIDAEPHAALPSAAGGLIVRDEERTQLRELSDADPELHWDRILFCAKEAVFKAWFPLTRRWLEFDDVSVKVRPDTTFEARLRVDDIPIATPGRTEFTGRWAVGRGLVATASWVAP